MTRALARLRLSLPPTLPLALLLVAALGSVASAQRGKGKIAILGIEAIPSQSTGTVDQADTDMAKALTIELRNRTKQGQGIYTLAPGSDKELVDEKLMGGCANENPNCMATIGQNLNCDVLMFGRLEKANPTTYNVTIQLINVGRKQRMTILSNEQLPVGTKNPALAAWAKNAYRKLTGEDSDGTLQIRVSNAERGSVLINEDHKGNITSGQATITLPDGRYRVAIEADGFKRWEDKEVTIRAGETTTRGVDLIPRDATIEGPDGNDIIISTSGTVSGTKNRTPFKIAAAVGLGVGAIAGTVWAYSFFGEIKKFKDSTGPIYERDMTVAEGEPGAFKQSNDGFFGDADCDRSDVRNFGEGNVDVNGVAQDPKRNRLFNEACNGYSRTKWAIPTTIGFGLVGVGALIYLIVQKDDVMEQDPSRNPIGKRTSRRRFTVTPIISPETSGATVQFDW